MGNRTRAEQVSVLDFARMLEVPIEALPIDFLMQEASKSTIVLIHGDGGAVTIDWWITSLLKSSHFRLLLISKTSDLEQLIHVLQVPA